MYADLSMSSHEIHKPIDEISRDLQAHTPAEDFGQCSCTLKVADANTKASDNN